MSGTNADDNVKFCFTTSIGGALKPSSENCYRVSKTNSYYLKVYNPYIMYKLRIQRGFKILSDPQASNRF